MSTTSATAWFKIALVFGVISTIAGCSILGIFAVYRFIGVISTNSDLTYYLFEYHSDWLRYAFQPAWSLFVLALSLISVAIGIFAASANRQLIESTLRRLTLLILFGSLTILAFELIVQGYSSIELPNFAQAYFPNEWTIYTVSIVSLTVGAGLLTLLGWLNSLLRSKTILWTDAIMLVIGYLCIGACLYIQFFYDLKYYAVGPLALGSLLFTGGWWRITSRLENVPLLTKSIFDRTLVISAKIGLCALLTLIIFTAGYVLGGYKVFNPNVTEKESLYTNIQQLHQTIQQLQQTSSSATLSK
jgi:hypothetical protein